MNSGVETYGFNNLEETFKNFALKQKRSIIISAFRKAVKPTVDQARMNAPKGRTGNLKKSIGVVGIRDEVGIYVGARIRGGLRGYHGYIVEKGTVERFRKTKNNAPTGKMKYSRFFKKAADSTEKQVINTVADEWYRAIDRFIVKNKIDR